MAFQIPENLFQRIKAHLERETVRTGKKLTQRDFVLGLVVAALDEADRQAGMASLEPEEQLQEAPGVPTDEAAAADPDAAENSELSSDTPIDGGSTEDDPDYGAAEGETSSINGDMGREGDAGVDEGLMASGGGEADGNDD